jgi:hypothetical protein
VRWPKQPGAWIACQSIHSGKSFSNAIRRCHVGNRVTSYVESLIIENGSVPRRPVECDCDDGRCIGCQNMLWNIAILAMRHHGKHRAS